MSGSKGSPGWDSPGLLARLDLFVNNRLKALSPVPGQAPGTVFLKAFSRCCSLSSINIYYFIKKGTRKLIHRFIENLYETD